MCRWIARRSFISVLGCWFTGSGKIVRSSRLETGVREVVQILSRLVLSYRLAYLEGLSRMQREI